MVLALRSQSPAPQLPGTPPQGSMSPRTDLHEGTPIVMDGGSLASQLEQLGPSQVGIVADELSKSLSKALNQLTGLMNGVAKIDKENKKLLKRCRSVAAGALKRCGQNKNKDMPPADTIELVVVLVGILKGEISNLQQRVKRKKNDALSLMIAIFSDVVSSIDSLAFTHIPSAKSHSVLLDLALELATSPAKEKHIDPRGGLENSPPSKPTSTSPLSLPAVASKSENILNAVDELQSDDDTFTFLQPLRQDLKRINTSAKELLSQPSVGEDSERRCIGLFVSVKSIAVTSITHMLSSNISSGNVKLSLKLLQALLGFCEPHDFSKVIGRHFTMLPDDVRTDGDKPAALAERNNSRLTAEVEGLKEKLAENEALLAETLRETNEMRVRVQELETANAETALQVQVAEKERDHSRSTLASLEDREKEKDIELSKLIEKTEDLRAVERELLERVAQYETAGAAQKEQIESLKKELEESSNNQETELKASEVKLAEVKREYEEKLEAMRKEVEKACAETEMKGQLLEDLESTQSKVAELSNMKEELEETLEKLNDEVAAAEEAKERVEKEVLETSQELTDATQRVKSAEDSLSELHEQIEAQLGQRGDLADKIDEESLKQEALRLSTEELDAAVSQKREEFNVLSKEMEQTEEVSAKTIQNMEEARSSLGKAVEVLKALRCQTGDELKEPEEKPVTERQDSLDNNVQCARTSDMSLLAAQIADESVTLHNLAQAVDKIFDMGNVQRAVLREPGLNKPQKNSPAIVKSLSASVRKVIDEEANRERPRTRVPREELSGKETEAKSDPQQENASAPTPRKEKVDPLVNKDSSEGEVDEWDKTLRRMKYFSVLRKMNTAADQQDTVDGLMEEYHKDPAMRSLIDMMPYSWKRLSKDLYQFGPRKLRLKVINGEVHVRVGAGYVSFTEFAHKSRRSSSSSHGLDTSFGSPRP